MSRPRWIVEVYLGHDATLGELVFRTSFYKAERDRDWAVAQAVTEIMVLGQPSGFRFEGVRVEEVE